MQNTRPNETHVCVISLYFGLLMETYFMKLAILYRLTPQGR